jgi:hypothetical protein
VKICVARLRLVRLKMIFARDKLRKILNLIYLNSNPWLSVGLIAERLAYLRNRGLVQ